MSDTIVKTTADTDVAQAAVIENQTTGAKELKMRGPLSEVFHKALHILFGKKNGLSGSYSLESFKNLPKTKIETFSVNANEITSADVSEIISTESFNTNSHVIAFNEFGRPINNPHFESMKAVCKARGIGFHTNFDSAVESIVSQGNKLITKESAK